MEYLEKSTLESSRVAYKLLKNLVKCVYNILNLHLQHGKSLPFLHNLSRGDNFRRPMQAFQISLITSQAPQSGGNIRNTWFILLLVCLINPLSDFWVCPGDSERFLVLWCLPVRKFRRLHTTETTVNLTKPSNHPNSAPLTSILKDQGPYYASFPPKGEMSRFCLQKSHISTIEDGLW